jgi:hypothetical protein
MPIAVVCGDTPSPTHDTEILHMAVFKLQDTARRLVRLARDIESPQARARLTSVATELRESEQRLWALVVGTYDHRNGGNGDSHRTDRHGTEPKRPV